MRCPTVLVHQSLRVEVAELGGDEWTQTGPYEPDLPKAFRALQERELALDDHGFPGRTIEQLWSDEQWHEYIFTGGTGTVLDFPLVVEATSTDDGPFLRPLTDGEVRPWAPDGKPTREQWLDALHSERLDFPGRAHGNCTVLYRDGLPVEIGYWGCTAD